MATHEEAGAIGLDVRDQRPVAHVEYRDLPLVDMRYGHHSRAVALPGDTGPQMRHPFQRQVGHLDLFIEIKHLPALTAPGRPDDVAVIQVEEEVVQVVGCLHSVQREIADDGLVTCGPYLRPADLPHLGNITQGRDEAVTGRGGIHGADPRGVAIESLYRNDGDQFEVTGIQQHQSVGQVVAGQHIVAVGRNSDVAHVDASAYLGGHFQIVDIVLGYPAIAGAKIDVTPVR